MKDHDTKEMYPNMVTFPNASTCGQLLKGSKYLQSENYKHGSLSPCRVMDVSATLGVGKSADLRISPYEQPHGVQGLNL